MSQVQFELDPTKSPVYEAGTVPLAVLALPDGDDTARGNLVASLCHLAITAQYDPSDLTARHAQSLKPIYAIRSEDQVRRDLKKIERHLRDRVIAARMAIAFFPQALTGGTAKLPEGAARASACTPPRVSAVFISQRE
jgi:hypothetical protein